MRLAAIPLQEFGVIFRPLLQRANSTASVGKQSVCEAQVLLKQEGAIITIEARLQNRSSVERWCCYELRVDCQTSSGSSRNVYTGRVKALAWQARAIFKTRLLATTAGHYQVWLRLLNDHGQILAEDCQSHQLVVR